MDKQITLSDCVELYAVNDDCVVLKVKQGCEMDLICLGCFNGDETMFRLTRGRDVTCTVWRGEKSFSWHWGYGGFTIVTDRVRTMGKIIQQCIECDFGIKCNF